MAPKHESTVFSNIYIFVRGEFVRVYLARELLWTRFFFGERMENDRMQGEIYSFKPAIQVELIKEVCNKQK